MKWIVLALALTSCTTMDTKLKSFVGRPLSEVIAKNGLPTKTMKISDTTEIDEWISGSAVNGNYAGCVVDLTTIGGIVDKWAYRGPCNWYEQ